MGNNHLLKTTIEGAPHEWRRHYHRGYVDAQNGKWAADYEKMSRNEQIAYEQGRLTVREAIAAGLGLIVWRGDKAGARAIDGLWHAIHAKIGHPVVPQEWEQKRP